MPPHPKKVGDTDESLRWVDVVKSPSGFRNGPQYVDPSKRLVEETQVTQVESDKMDEMCDSVSSLSLTSSPGSGTGSNMVSPDKTMLGPSDIMGAASATAHYPSSKHQARTLDDRGGKKVGRCLDTELAITQQTAPPLQQAASLGIADIDTTVNSQGTKKRRSQMQADYVCLQMLRTIMSQNSSIAAMLKEDGAKKTKKDLFKEIVHAWRKSSDEKINTLKDINMNYYCKKILDGVQEILSEEHRERFAMLAENGNAQTLEEPLCEYDSMLLQLALRVEKNQKLAEVKEREAAREKMDKSARFDAKEVESEAGGWCQRTVDAVELVHARVRMEENGRKTNDNARKRRGGAASLEQEDLDVMYSEGEEESQICRRQEEDDEVRSTNARPTEKNRGK
jgi:hypothetical protein